MKYHRFVTIVLLLSQHRTLCSRITDTKYRTTCIDEYTGSDLTATSVIRTMFTTTLAVLTPFVFTTPHTVRLVLVVHVVLSCHAVLPLFLCRVAHFTAHKFPNLTPTMGSKLLNVSATCSHNI